MHSIFSKETIYILTTKLRAKRNINQTKEKRGAVCHESPKKIAKLLAEKLNFTFIYIYGLLFFQRYFMLNPSVVTLNITNIFLLSHFTFYSRLAGNVSFFNTSF